MKPSQKDRQRNLHLQGTHPHCNEAAELEHRRRMRESREELERFVSSLPEVDDSTNLMREDRER